MSHSSPIEPTRLGLVSIDSSNQAKLLRQSLKKQRANISETARHNSSIAISKNIAQHTDFQAANSIACYFASPAEIDLAPLIELALKSNKTCYFPVIDGTDMSFYPYQSGDQLKLNQYGLKEPLTYRESVNLAEIDFILCPLVGFNRNGDRLGMGGGFYDRALAPLKQRKEKKIWGVGYAQQESALIQPEPWDIAMDGIFTDRETIDCNGFNRTAKT